jgi:hypothetical protein
MLRKKIVWAAFSLALVLTCRCAWAQTGPTSALYQIVAGSYSECCGIGGNDFGYDLPNENQKFVRFTLDPQRQFATMTFLAEDARTAFSIVPCPPAGAINFSFSYGLIFPNFTIFHVDPGPPPYQMYWNYAVSNSPNRLRIDGMVGTAQSPCTDVPTRFSHSNVVAALVPPPRLSITEFSKEGALLFIQGNAGWTNVIEASTDLNTWTPISTNLMPATLCPVCPYILFRDSASTNLARRFYRCFEVP